jgi:hypothetical protein
VVWIALADSLQLELRALARCHLAPSTELGYRQSEIYYLRFLAAMFGARDDAAAAAQRIIMELRDPQDSLLALYAAFHSRPDPVSGVRTGYTSIKQYFKGVAHCLRMHGCRTPLAAFPLLQIALSGARRTNSVTPRPKTPITPDMLLRFVQELSGRGSTSATMVAAMLVCFFAMLRKSSVCADAMQPLSSFSGLRGDNMRVCAQSYSLILDLQHSKTNQYGDRVTIIRVAGLRGHPLDPVAAVLAMRALCPAPGALPAFCMLLNGSIAALSHQAFVATTKTLVGRMGGVVGDYSGHSYRRGGATLAHAAGVSALDIMRTGDWASLQYLDYIWRSPEQCLRCSSTMLHAVANGRVPGLTMGVMAR